jgi:transketolase
MNPTPYAEKLEAFGLHVISINAHDFDQIAAALAEAKQTKGQPTAIIARSVKGKGVSFMENQASWHGNAPNDAQYQQALEELKK